MANNLKLSNATVDVQGDATASMFDNGYLRLYDGTQPTNADTAIGAQVLLAELRFAATGIATSVNGVLTANALTPDSSANASGTCTWYRALKSDGTTVICDGSAGTADADLVLNSVAISSGAAVSVSSFTHTIPKA